MWPFLQTQRKQEAQANLQPKSDNKGSEGQRRESQEHRRPMSMPQLIEQMGNVEDFRTNDAALKFWLPDAAYRAVEDISELNNETMSSSCGAF